MPRHELPDNVRAYFEMMEKGPPRCCHTCVHYLPSGKCEQYGMEPPADFAATEDACPKYRGEPPF